MTFTANGKRQKWNFCRHSSAVCTVEWNYLYLQWIVGEVIPFLCVYLRIRRKELKIRSYLCRLPSAVNVMLNLSNVEVANLTMLLFKPTFTIWGRGGRGRVSFSSQSTNLSFIQYYFMEIWCHYFHYTCLWWWTSAWTCTTRSETPC